MPDDPIEEIPAALPTESDEDRQSRRIREAVAAGVKEGIAAARAEDKAEAAREAAAAPKKKPGLLGVL